MHYFFAIYNTCMYIVVIYVCTYVFSPYILTIMYVLLWDKQGFGSGSSFQISLEPDPDLVLKSLDPDIRFQPKKSAERALKVIYFKTTERL